MVGHVAASVTIEGVDGVIIPTRECVVAAFTVAGHAAAGIAVEGVAGNRASRESIVAALTVAAAFTVVGHVADRVTINSVDDVEKSSKEGVVAALGKVKHAAAGIADQKICDCCSRTVGDAGENIVGAPLMVG